MPKQSGLDGWCDQWRNLCAKISGNAAAKTRQRLTVWRDHWHCFHSIDQSCWLVFKLKKENCTHRQIGFLKIRVKKCGV